MSWFLFILGSLSVYRLSLLVSKEDGPYWIFRKLRKLPPVKSSAREGLACIFCCSVYASALVTSYLWYWGFIAEYLWPLWWLGMSGVAICVNQSFTKGEL